MHFSLVYTGIQEAALLGICQNHCTPGDIVGLLKLIDTTDYDSYAMSVRQTDDQVKVAGSQGKQAACLKLKKLKTATFFYC